MSDFDPAEVERVAQGAFPDLEVLDYPMDDPSKPGYRQLWYVSPYGEKYFMTLARPVLGAQETEPSEWWALNAGEAIDTLALFQWMHKAGMIKPLENWGFPVSFNTLRDLKTAFWYAVNPALKTRKPRHEAIDTPPAIHQQAHQFAPDFIQFVKNLENPDRVGWNDRMKVWNPHDSPEGGRQTIAYGHKLKPGEEARFAHGISEEDAEKLLVQDLLTARQEVHDYIQRRYKVRLTLDPKVEEMLVEFAFNLGSLSKFPKFVDAVLRADWKTAYRESIRSYRTPTGDRKELKTRNDAFRQRYFGKMVKEDEEPQEPQVPEPSQEPAVQPEPEPEPEPEFDPEEVEQVAQLKLPLEVWAQDQGFTFFSVPKNDPEARVYQRIYPMRRLVNNKTGRHYDQLLVYVRLRYIKSTWGERYAWARFTVKCARQDPDPENPGKLKWWVASKRFTYVTEFHEWRTLKTTSMADFYKQLDGFMNAINDALTDRGARTPRGFQIKLKAYDHAARNRFRVLGEAEEPAFDPEEVEQIAHGDNPFFKREPDKNIWGQWGFKYWRPDPKRPGKRQTLASGFPVVQGSGDWYFAVANVFPGAYGLTGAYRGRGGQAAVEEFEQLLMKYLAFQKPQKPQDRRFQFKVSVYNPRDGSTTYYVYLSGRKPLLLGYIQYHPDRGWLLTGIHRQWFSDGSNARMMAAAGYLDRPWFKELTPLLDLLYASTNDAAHAKAMELRENVDPEEIEQIAGSFKPAWHLEPRPDKIWVGSSWGDFVINDKGEVLERNIGEDFNQGDSDPDDPDDVKYLEHLQSIKRFDVDEHEAWWHERIAGTVDILDIGYWYVENEQELYNPAEDDWRRMARDQRMQEHQSKPFGWFNPPTRSAAAHFLARCLVEDFDPEEVEDIASMSLAPAVPPGKRALEQRTFTSDTYREWTYYVLTDAGHTESIGVVGHHEDWRPFESWAVSGPDILGIEYFPGAVDAVRFLFTQSGHADKLKDLYIDELDILEDVDPEEAEQVAQGAVLGQQDLYEVSQPGAVVYIRGDGRLMVFAPSYSGPTNRWLPGEESVNLAYEVGANGQLNGVTYTWAELKTQADQGKDMHVKLLLQNDQYPSERWAMKFLGMGFRVGEEKRAESWTVRRITREQVGKV